jgi:hypothetical protein
MGEPLSASRKSSPGGYPKDRKLAGSPENWTASHASEEIEPDSGEAREHHHNVARDRE